MKTVEIAKGGREYIGYDYKTVSVNRDSSSMYLDCYQSFGWILDDSLPTEFFGGITRLKLKRDRKIANKMELTRLQQHFEACMHEIAELERSRIRKATVVSIAVGIIGTAFIAGATFAVTSAPPLIFLCILLAIPGFAGWALPPFLFKSLAKKRDGEVNALIEQKYNVINDICEKGSRLL